MGRLAPKTNLNGVKKMTEKTTTRLLKKMTPKTVLGETVKVPEKRTKMYTIYGVANGFKKGETAFGPWTMLTGNFEAVKDGVRYISGVCSLPQPMHDMMVAAVKNSDSDVSFACDVIIDKTDKPGIGYEYFAEPLIEQTENDPLAALRDQVTPLLAAPEEAPSKKPTK